MYYIFFLYLCTCVLKIICSTLLDVYVPFFKLMNWAVVTLKYCIEVFGLWMEGISFMRFSLCVSVSGELEKLQAECCSLQNECDSLRAEKTTLMQKLHRLEEELDRWVTFTQTDSLCLLDHFTQQTWVTSLNGFRVHYVRFPTCSLKWRMFESSILHNNCIALYLQKTFQMIL